MEYVHLEPRRPRHPAQILQLAVHARDTSSDQGQADPHGPIPQTQVKKTGGPVGYRQKLGKVEGCAYGVQIGRKCVLLHRA